MEDFLPHLIAGGVTLMTGFIGWCAFIADSIRLSVVEIRKDIAEIKKDGDDIIQKQSKHGDILSDHEKRLITLEVGR